MNKGRRLHTPDDVAYQQVQLGQDGRYLTVTYCDYEGKVLEQHEVLVADDE